MPDLIYNIKFKIDSKIGDFGQAGAAKSLEELNDSLDKTNRSTGNLGKEVKGVLEKNKLFISSNDKLKRSIDLKRKATQGDLREIVKTNQAASKRAQLIRKQRIDLEKLTSSGKLNRAERTRLNGLISRLTTQEQQLIVQLQKGRAALRGQEVQTESLTKDTNKLADAKKRLGKQTSSNNKAFSTANQTLFSFSDGIQDASQFIQGGQVNFAQGMRAVGNNIGFTAELMGNLTTKTGGLKGAFKALGRSLLGPGGILIGINLLVTAATVIPQLFNEGKKSAEDLEKELDGLNDTARKTAEIISGSGAFEFGIESLKSQKQVLVDILKERQKVNKIDLESLETALEEAKVRARKLKESNQFRVFFEGEIASQEMVIQGKKDVLSLEEEIERVKAESAKTDKEILSLNRQIVSETEARRLAGLKLQEEGFVDALRASLNIEPEDVVIDNMDEMSATINSLFGEQLARESVKAVAPVDVLIDDSLEVFEGKIPDMFNTINGLVQSTVDGVVRVSREFEELLGLEDTELPPLYQTVAFAEQEIARLQIELAKTVSDEEAKILRERIQNYQDFIDSRTKGITDSTETETNALTEEQKERQTATLSMLKVTDQFTDGFTSLMKTQIKSEFQVAKARGASAKQLEMIRRKQFEVEKKSAIAEALINTAKAITENLGKPKQIAIAAALGAIQIAKIKATKFGADDSGGGGASTGSGGISPISSSKSGVSEPTQQISFLPNATTSGQAPPTIDVKIDRAGLAVAVGKGGREIGNKQVRV